MSSVAVFGAGSWGTAFSMILADAGNDVTMWGRREDVCSTINDKHENTDYLPGIELPPTISATHDAEKALAGAELMGLAELGTVERIDPCGTPIMNGCRQIAITRPEAAPSR